MTFPAQSGFAADWTVSPYRAQLASAQADESGSDSTAPADIGLKKNIGRGVMFSLIIPGTGQLYAGSWLRALPWFAVEVAAWAVYANYHGSGRDKTDEFEAYAGWRDTPNHFNARPYMFAEWLVAKDSTRAIAGRPFTGNFDTWSGLQWTQRSTYLPAPFTHDVMTSDRQQFFEMIGKYFSQFGWGWQDTYSANQGQIGETNPPNWTVSGDNPATTAFDGQSAMFFLYADMRGEANDLLDKGNIAMEVVLVNHVLSALDAAFAVRSYNKKVTTTPAPTLGDLRLRYDLRDFEGSRTRFLTLSLPLD